MKQCLLSQGTKSTTGWIDEKAARVGCFVELLPDGGTWCVSEVFGHALTEDVVKRNQLLHRHSLPSVQGMR